MTATTRERELRFERLAQHQDAASRTFAPLRIIPQNLATFNSTFSSVRVGEVVVCRIRSTPYTVKRQHVGSADADLVKIALHKRGRAGVTQGGRQVLVRPGELVPYQTSMPYELPFWDDSDSLVVAMPRQLLGASAIAVSRRLAQPFRARTGVQRLFSALLDGVLDAFDGDAEVYNHALADSLVSLVVAAVISVEPESIETPSPLADRILAYCEANLSDPGLCVESVAAAHHVSVRYVHKALKDRGFTLAAWIRDRRLTLVRRDLATPGLQSRSIAVIASAWGILDASHLSRAFKSRYGLTPAEWRASGSRAA
jgi:AraC-like DNA-binding protein